MLFRLGWGSEGSALRRLCGVGQATFAGDVIRGLRAFGTPARLTQWKGGVVRLCVPQRRRNLRPWSSVRDSIVEAAMGRDIVALAQVRRPALLCQVFAIAAASPAEIISLEKIQGQLQDPGALETIAHYLGLLEEAYLVAPLQKHALRPPRRRAAPPKLVTLNNALCAVTDPRGIPDRERDRDRYGRWVGNACLAFAWNSGQRITYWREEPLEVDGQGFGARRDPQCSPQHEFLQIRCLICDLQEPMVWHDVRAP